MFIKSVVALALLASSVVAQTNYTTIDPGTVDPQLKASWCNGQQNVCKILCSSSVKTNTCDAGTLAYSCLCASNSSAPDLADYMNSMPYYICEKSYDLCIAAHPNDQAGQDNCTTNIRSHCGTLDVANFTAPASTASSSGAAPSATGASTTAAAGSASGTPSTTASSTTATTSKSAAVALLGMDYASGVIATGLIAIFSFML